MSVEQLARTLDQELAALVRGASLECLVCGEFVMRVEGGVIACPECRSLLVAGTVVPEVAVPKGAWAEGRGRARCELPSVTQAG